MKRILILSIICAFVLNSKAQSPVPTSWDCRSGTPPDGWTYENLNASSTNYSGISSCDGISSLRFDTDNEFLTIFFGQQPGTITYQIGGTSQGAPWEGTFTVQESVDGMSWVDITSYSNGTLPVGSAACLDESIEISNPASRYVRFFYTDKISGFNTRLDEIFVDEAEIEAATINVIDNVSGNSILNGTIAPAFNTSEADFTISNEGITDTLIINSIELNGINSVDFSISGLTFPLQIPPGETSELSIGFTPSMGVGSYVASVTIESNDLTNESYVFSLYAVSGDFATEPTAEVTAVNADVNKSYRILASFTGSGVLTSDILGGYILVRSVGEAVSASPEDGQTYLKGMGIGNAKVVYAGRPSSEEILVNSRYVEAGTEYHFAAFPYYGSGEYTNYSNQINDNTIISSSSLVASDEYSSISIESTTFPQDLKAVINPHTSIFYSNYSNTMVNLFLARDTFVTIGPNSFDRVIECVYSGEVKPFNDPFDWTNLGYSREHTFPHSWMASFPADEPELPEFNDQHNLFPARQTNVNALRCNYPLGEVNTLEFEFLEGKFGLDVNGNKVYEPRDEHKGRAARALMYMATCYDTEAADFSFNAPVGLTCSGNAINYPQDQNLMKKWHFMYPPTGFDIARNDFLDSLQTNRNPFIDNVDYACYIDFNTMSHIAEPANPCYLTSVSEIENMHLLAYPNPNTGDFRISFLGTGEALQISINDLSGKQVFKKTLNASSEVQILDISGNELLAGMYLVTVTGSKSFSSTPIVITK
jgi:hypothetical protein